MPRTTQLSDGLVETCSPRPVCFLLPLPPPSPSSSSSWDPRAQHYIHPSASTPDSLTSAPSPAPSSTALTPVKPRLRPSGTYTLEDLAGDAHMDPHTRTCTHAHTAAPASLLTCKCVIPNLRRTSKWCPTLPSPSTFPLSETLRSPHFLSRPPQRALKRAEVNSLTLPLPESSVSSCDGGQTIQSRTPHRRTLLLQSPLPPIPQTSPSALDHSPQSTKHALLLPFFCHTM